MKYLKDIYSVISYCLSISWKSTKLYTLQRILMSLISPFSILLSTFLTKKLIDLITRGDFSFHIYVIVIVYVGLRVLDIFLQKYRMYIQQLYDQKIRQTIELQVIQVSPDLNLERFDDPEFYNKLQMIKRDSNSIVMVLWQIIDCVAGLITLIYAVILLTQCNVILLILFIISAIPSAVINQKYTKSLYDLSLQQLNNERKLNHVYNILTSKNYAQDVRMYHTGGHLRGFYEKLWTCIYDNKKKVLKTRFIKTTISDLLNFSVYVLFILFILNKIINHVFFLSDYIFYTSMLDQLFSSIYRISSSVVQIYEDKIKINNIKDFLENSYVTQENGKEIEIQKINTIEFKNVSFKYPNTNNQVLSHISFKLNAGTKVALIGKNGSGKSTIIKLLVGFYDNYEGEILINNLELKTLDKRSLRKNISLCFQKPTIYGFNISENIILGNDYMFDEDKLKDSLIHSELYDTVSKLEKGTETCLTKHFDHKGVELSDGQYQKISLARMFYKESSVIIMDEPTSSIDPEAESNIFDRVNEYEDRIVFYVSHRLSNLSIADVIIVMEDGKIENIGTHSDLMNNSSIYKRVFECQAEKYERMM